MSSGLSDSALASGPYPERALIKVDPLEEACYALSTRLRTAWNGRNQQAKFLQWVDTFGESMGNLSPGELQGVVQELRTTTARKALEPRALAKAFALVRETSDRVLGKRHYPAQLLGGWIIANGMIAEMQTGEGKTLTATSAGERRGTCRCAGPCHHLQ